MAPPFKPSGDPFSQPLPGSTIKPSAQSGGQYAFGGAIVIAGAAPTEFAGTFSIDVFTSFRLNSIRVSCLRSLAAGAGEIPIPCHIDSFDNFGLNTNLPGNASNLPFSAIASPGRIQFIHFTPESPECSLNATIQAGNFSFDLYLDCGPSGLFAVGDTLSYQVVMFFSQLAR